MLPVFWVAQASSLELPTSLKDIKRADNNCYRDEVTAGEARLAAARRKADLQCAITVRELLNSNGQADSLMVDVRAKSEFDNFHIAEAINLSPSALKTKDIFKNKALTLIGNGKGEQELYAACADLKTAGFGKVRVLRGGMAAWLAKQQPIMGKIPAKYELVWLTPQELFQEMSFDANALLITPSASKMKSFAPSAVTVSADSINTIKAALKQRKNIPRASVVLIAGERYDRARIGQIITALDPVPVLVYAEPTAAYSQFLSTQKAVWVAHESGPKQPGCSSR